MRNAILAAVILLVPLASPAADKITPLDVKLGLWETTTSNQTSGAPPIPDELLARLTPDQRAKMEATFKAQQARAVPRVNKSCLTKEGLEKAMTWGNQDNNTCKRTVTTSSSSKQDIRFECGDESNRMKSSGTIHVEALNSENVKGTGTVQMTSGDSARSMNMQINFSAKWLSADCGALGKQ